MSEQLEEIIGSTYSSRYLCDFVPTECLGRGAFGVVFKVTKINDSRLYAVKRIRLPRREQARIRVMREVTTLSQLEHRNIVRYFSAWVEEPPAGWLEVNDPLWAQSLQNPNSELPSDMPPQMLPPLAKINPSLPDPRYNATIDDSSFIVFENSLSIQQSHASVSSHRNFENNEVEILPWTTTYLYIQQELCRKHTLRDWLRVETKRDQLFVLDIFSQIVDGLEYIHCRNLIHRDLKPSNILLAESGQTDLFTPTIKIGDFGLAISADTDSLSDDEIDKKNVNLDETKNRSEIFGNNLTECVGTRMYMSPEQHQRQPYCKRVDIYALGLIFVDLLVPFSTDMERVSTLSEVRNFKFPTAILECCQTECAFIRTMISHHPSDRPEASGIQTWLKPHITKVSTLKTLRGVGRCSLWPFVEI